jgi:SRSO17 transposase
VSRVAPNPEGSAERFAIYVGGLAASAGHADRVAPLTAYCTGLLLPGERKSVEPMAARLAPTQVRRMHQSLHHLVADAPWDDAEVLRQVRYRVLPAMTRKAPVVAWVIDDTGFPKKGRHSVGVARQYCGQLGKQDNCRVAVSLSVSTWTASLPIAWRLYLPEAWTEDRERRQKTGIPDTVAFQTKLEIALDQIREAVQEAVPAGPVLADAAYGNDTRFRQELTALELPYLVGIASSTTVWRPGEQPLPAKPWSGRGRPTTLLQRSDTHQPLAVKALAATLPATAWRTVTWRRGSRQSLRSRFAAARVRPAHRDDWRSTPHPEEWLLMEWPPGEPEPTKYWFGTVAADLSLRELVRLAKHRWIIERDYEELKQEVGIGHYEGRGWRGFHHHATLCIAAYGFLVAERARFSPSARVGALALATPVLPATFRPRGRPRAARAS